MSGAGGPGIDPEETHGTLPTARSKPAGPTSGAGREPFRDAAAKAEPQVTPSSDTTPPDDATRAVDTSPSTPADVPARQADVDLPGVAAKRSTRGRLRAARGGIAVAFLCGALGFALAAQLHSNDAGDARFGNLRQSDLVRILDELDAREKRLRAEISNLEFRHQTLNSKAQGSEAALADAQRRASELGILAGTAPAEGPGLVITLTERDKPLLADRVLDAVQELRGAGAEAIQIAGSSGDPVRIGASTYFTDAEAGIEVDGKQLAAPYALTAIGDPPTIERALKIPGGVVASVRQDGCDIQLEQRRTVQVNAVRTPRGPRFARPAS